jgi:general secretion pathway protein K
MELLLSKMPEPVNNPVPLEKRKNPAYRFNGQELTLAYAAPNSTISTRIYDEAGKINLLYLTKIQMQQLLEKRMGKDKERLEALDDAWQDWIDTDDTKRLNGAEKEYYEKLVPPYEPRNEKIQTIGELLMIKGFKEAFKGVELDTVFTIYGSTAGVNPNLATREVLLMLPGMTDEIANIILTQRREREFRTVQDFNEFMQPEQLAEFAPWVHFAASNFYTIALYPKDEAELKALEEKKNSGDKTSTVEKKPEPELDKDGKPKEEKIQLKNRQAYMVTVQIAGSNQAPKVLMTNPYGTLPDCAMKPCRLLKPRIRFGVLQEVPCLQLQAQTVRVVPVVLVHFRPRVRAEVARVVALLAVLVVHLPQVEIRLRVGSNSVGWNSVAYSTISTLQGDTSRHDAVSVECISIAPYTFTI